MASLGSLRFLEQPNVRNNIIELLSVQRRITAARGHRDVRGIERIGRRAAMFDERHQFGVA